MKVNEFDEERFGLSSCEPTMEFHVVVVVEFFFLNWDWIAKRIWTLLYIVCFGGVFI